HSLVVATNFASPGGVAPDRARLGDLAFLARRIPQRLGAHRHPFAVCRHHLQGVRAESIVRRRLAPRVELFEVPRRADRERLALALGHMPRRGAVDLLDGAIEGAGARPARATQPRRAPLPDSALRRAEIAPSPRPPADSRGGVPSPAPVPSPALLPAREPPTRPAAANSAPPDAPPPAACPGNPGTH